MPRFLVAFAFLLACTSALAQSRKAGQSEMYLAPVFTVGQDYSFQGATQASTDTGFGLALGWNRFFTSKASGGIEMSWGGTDYRTTVQPGIGNPNPAQTVRGSIETWNLRFNGTYHFMNGDFTPFVTGGLGWTYIDSNIPSGLPQNVCWWYPWWGYVCGLVQPTFTTTKFAYNAGLGLRQEFGNQFVRGQVGYAWLDLGGSSGDTRWIQYKVDFGVRF